MGFRVYDIVCKGLRLSVKHLGLSLEFRVQGLGLGFGVLRLGLRLGMYESVPSCARAGRRM